MYYVRTLDNRPDDIVRDVEEKRLDFIVVGYFVTAALVALAAGIFLGGFIAYH